MKPYFVNSLPYCLLWLLKNVRGNFVHFFIKNYLFMIKHLVWVFDHFFYTSVWWKLKGVLTQNLFSSFHVSLTIWWINEFCSGCAKIKRNNNPIPMTKYTWNHPNINTKYNFLTIIPSQLIQKKNRLHTISSYENVTYRKHQHIKYWHGIQSTTPHRIVCDQSTKHISF